MADWTVQDYWKQRGREGRSGKEKEVEISMQISKVVQLLINVYTQYNDVNSLYKKVHVPLTPDLVKLLLLNKVSMGSTAASTSTPMMVTVTPPLHIGGDVRKK